ncbi:phage protein Gp36 family protein [Bacteroides acidifaciens]|uniref:phage protein Gp36 family protein n=1 Tax=Bacteroides acidifaciens TaxID=85831 RepID=UPI00301529B0
MFLTLDDYSSVCDDYEFKQITEKEDVRLKAEAAAMEEIASYLRSRYDIDRAFAAVGSCRNAMLVQVAVNISLWLMVHRLPQNMGHERRECLYDDAIKWLRDVQASKASPDLPLYISADGNTDARNPVRSGCMKPNRYDY